MMFVLLCYRKEFCWLSGRRFLDRKNRANQKNQARTVIQLDQLREPLKPSQKLKTIQNCRCKEE